MMKYSELAREAIKALPEYKSARSLFEGTDDTIYLDANECAYEPYVGASGLNRYPAQQPQKAIEALCRLYDVSSKNLILTRGADEAIDVLVRSFCEAGQDKILISSPTFPMYAQAARIQGVEIIDAPLQQEGFALDVALISRQMTEQKPKLIFICSPNNPTACAVPVEDIERVCRAAEGLSLIIVDETYIEFSGKPSMLEKMAEYPNLVVLRTISKSYAAAGIRAGVAIAAPDVISLLRKVEAPYPIPQPVAREIIKILAPKNKSKLDKKRAATMERKAVWEKRIGAWNEVIEVFPSDTNFVLVRFKDASSVIKKCRKNNMILRDQSHVKGLENCIRITIGSDEDMALLESVVLGQDRTSTENDRKAKVQRSTSETSIDVSVNLDRSSPIAIETGIGFYDHMLEQIARHAGISLVLSCEGDLEIDPHHSVEDCAIALGEALKIAIGDKCGINRYGFVVPMDEALCEVALDLSGRSVNVFEADFPDKDVGGLPCDMIEHIFRSLSENMKTTCHIKVKGQNTHHMVEACFKAFGRALGQAIRRETNIIPSTKGSL